MGIENSKEMNVESAIAQVLALQQTANDLQQMLNQMLAGANGRKITDPQDITKIFGYMLSSVILRSLATEIILKILSFKTRGNYRKIHDLIELFNDLDDKTQKEISSIEENLGVRPIRQILEKHRNDFTDWRYLLDQSEVNVTMQDLDKALEVLISTERILRSC